MFSIQKLEYLYYNIMRLENKYKVRSLSIIRMILISLKFAIYNTMKHLFYQDKTINYINGKQTKEIFVKYQFNLIIKITIVRFNKY